MSFFQNQSYDRHIENDDMLDPKLAIIEAIPAVHTLDLQGLWALQSQHPVNSGVSYSIKAISQVCNFGSDPVAVWARTTLISILSQQGLLDNWRDHDGLQQAVFQAAAVFPLPNGLQELNPNAFIAALPLRG
jgi:hypothetical protein